MRVVMVVGVGLVSALMLMSSAAAQSVPGPTATALVDSVAKPTCEGGLAQPYDSTYSAACFLPVGVVAGSPWMTAVRAVITPATGSPISKVIPRSALVRHTTTAACTPNVAPCLQIPLGAVPVGASTVKLAFLDAENLPGPESPAVPFTGTRPSLPAPEGSTVR